MIEIRPFNASYIQDAASLFAVTFEEARAALPLIPVQDNLQSRVEGKLQEIVANPGFAAFNGEKLVGYMIELFSVEDFMGMPTAFVIDLFPFAIQRDGKQAICQLLYKAMAQTWIERRLPGHQFSIFAHDDVLAHTFFRLTFGMTHFEFFRTLDPPEGEIPSLDIRYLENEDPVRAIDQEHHAYYPNPPLFWIPHDFFYEGEKNRIREGEAEIIAAFIDGDAVAYFVLTKGTAETELFKHPGTGQIKAAYARPSCRGKGIGKALLAESTRWAKANNLERLYVEGESANIYGGNFWCDNFRPASYSLRRCVDPRVTKDMFSNT